MKSNSSFVAYFDLVAVGEASRSDGGRGYFEQLGKFRVALCEVALQHLTVADRVYAFSDCAFVESSDVKRLGKFLTSIQKELWLSQILFKGAIAKGALKPVEFSAAREREPKDQALLKKVVLGQWFEIEAVKPAEAEKALKGIAVQICDATSQESPDTQVYPAQWIEKCTTYSCFFPTESTKRPTVIRDLLIPSTNLPMLDSVLRWYLISSHASKRVGRNYISLIVTWIRSHDYSKVSADKDTEEWVNAPAPLTQLIQNRRLQTEMLRHAGSEIIFYALLHQVEVGCKDAKIKEQVYRELGGIKKLTLYAEHVPAEICPEATRRTLVEKRVDKLFSGQS